MTTAPDYTATAALFAKLDAVATQALARRQDLRAQFVVAVEANYRFHRYDDVIEADGAAEAWQRIKDAVTTTDVAPEEAGRWVWSMIRNHALFFNTNRSTSPSTNTHADAEHAAWLRALAILEGVA